MTTDMHHSPEILPLPSYVDKGRRTICDPIGEWDLYDWLKRAPWDKQAPLMQNIVILAMKSFFVIPLLGIPPLLYRLSLKSTAIVWFPLLWASRAFAPKREPLLARLQLFVKSDVLRIMLVVSTVALALLLGKLVFWNEIRHSAEAWNASVGGRILSIHVAPGVIEWWQLATAVNSLLAIGLWLFVRSCLRRYGVGVPWPERRVEGLMGWGLFVRRLLSSYTIICVGYMYVREATTWQLPPLGGKPFPWM